MLALRSPLALALALPLAGLACDKEPAPASSPPVVEASPATTPSAAPEASADVAAPATDPPPAAQAPGGPLQVGQRAPDFSLPDATGQSFALADALAKGPVVAVFYRGDW